MTQEASIDQLRVIDKGIHIGLGLPDTMLPDLYSTDLLAAIALVETLQRKGFNVHITAIRNGGYHAKVIPHLEATGDLAASWNDTLPEAVARAAFHALQGVPF
jgi:hypothetical protein